MKTVVGLYSTVAEANKVKAALESEGYEAAHVKVMNQNNESGTSSSAQGEGFTEKVKDFFSGFSDHKDDHAQYANRIGVSGALLAVTVPDDEADETADLLQSHGATGIQDEYSTSGAASTAVLGNEQTAYKGSEAIGDQVIPVVQEDLVVGKREVSRGGVRIYSHLVEEAVSADVSLRNEQIIVDRTPVNRAATEADFNTTPGVIEVTASGEEAVVGKTSRVVEEVRVGKQASERTEQVSDTVRHTEVDVEPTSGLKTENRY